MIPSGPVYVLDSEETYQMAVTTSFHPGRVAKGNITMRVLAKPVNSTNEHYRLAMEEHFLWASIKHIHILNYKYYEIV